MAALAFAAIRQWVSRTPALDGVPVTQELSALGEASVWGMMLVAAIGFGSIVAVYLAVVIELFSRRVVGWSMQVRQTTNVGNSPQRDTHKGVRFPDRSR